MTHRSNVGMPTPQSLTINQRGARICHGLLMATKFLGFGQNCGRIALTAAFDEEVAA